MSSKSKIRHGFEPASKKTVRNTRAYHTMENLRRKTSLEETYQPVLKKDPWTFRRALRSIVCADDDVRRLGGTRVNVLIGCKTLQVTSRPLDGSSPGSGMNLVCGEHSCPHCSRKQLPSYSDHLRQNASGFEGLVGVVVPNKYADVFLKACANPDRGFRTVYAGIQARLFLYEENTLGHKWAMKRYTTLKIAEDTSPETWDSSLYPAELAEITNRKCWTELRGTKLLDWILLTFRTRCDVFEKAVYDYQNARVAHRAKEREGTLTDEDAVLLKQAHERFLVAMDVWLKMPGKFNHTKRTPKGVLTWVRRADVRAKLRARAREARARAGIPELNMADLSEGGKNIVELRKCRQGTFREQVVWSSGRTPKGVKFPVKDAVSHARSAINVANTFGHVRQGIGVVVRKYTVNGKEVLRCQPAGVTDRRFCLVT